MANAFDADKLRAVANVHRLPAKQSAIIGQQILTLKLITTKVNYAFNGMEVEWQDKGK